MNSTTSATPAVEPTVAEPATVAPTHDLSHLEDWFKTEFDSAVVHMRTTMTSVEDESKALLEKLAAKIKEKA